MRILIFIWLMGYSCTIFGQHMIESDTQSIVSFEKENYTSAETEAQKVFKLQPSEELARIYYYALRYQGEDLQAALFKKNNPQYTFALSEGKKGLEIIYLEAGPRIASGNNASMFYSTIGGTIRLSPLSRLWIAGSWLTRSGDNHFSQYEGFASLFHYLGDGWTINPSAHYNYTPYGSVSTADSTFSYSNDFNDYTLRTNASQHTWYTSDGTEQYLNASIRLRKRWGRVSVDIEPSWHYTKDKSNNTFRYTSTGTIDSVRKNNVVGSRPYNDAGVRINDSSRSIQYYQLGIAVSYRPPLHGEPLSLRAALYLMKNEQPDVCYATYVYAQYRLSKRMWIHASYLFKQNMPLVLNWEGQYFNTLNRINTRASCSLQLLPLKKLSPVITYQFEQDQLSDNKSLVAYHSLYFSLKYRF